MSKATTAFVDPLQRDKIMAAKLAAIIPYISKKNAVEVRMNRPTEVIVTFADGSKKFESDPQLNFQFLKNMAQILANKTGQIFTEENPILSAKISGGHRVQIMGFDSTSHGFAMVIRIKRHVDYKFSDFGLSPETEKTIISAIKNRNTILISGGTGSGKTTFTNMLIPHIAADERIVTIEGVAELEVPHKDWCPLTYSENGTSISGNTAAGLLRASLRLSPDRLILGEIHTENAHVFAQAINTGHEGSIATIHANGPASAIVALIAKMILSGHADSGSIGILKDQICQDIKGVMQIDRDHHTHKRVGVFKTMDEIKPDLKFIEKDVKKALEDNKTEKVL